MPIAPAKPTGRPRRREREHDQRVRSAREGEPLFLAEELERDGRAVLERRAGDAHRARHQRKDDLVRDEQVVPSPVNVPGRGDAAGCRLGEAPHAVDDRRLQGRRAAKLEPQVAREPRGGDDVHLLPDSHGVGRHEQVDSRLARAEAAARAPAAAGSRGPERRGGGGPIRGDVHHDRRRFDGVLSLDRARGADLPMSGAHRAEPDLEHGRADGPGAEADLRPLAAGDDFETGERGERDLHRDGRVAHRPQRVGQLLADRDPVLVHRGLELRPGSLERGERARQHRQERPHQSLTPPELPCRRRCCSSRVSPLAALHRVENLLGLTLRQIPGLRLGRLLRLRRLRPAAGWRRAPPPPPPCGGGGGRRRSASSRFHLARADEGCSSSACRRRSVASSSISSRREVSPWAVSRATSPRL